MSKTFAASTLLTSCSVEAFSPPASLAAGLGTNKPGNFSIRLTNFFQRFIGNILLDFLNVLVVAVIHLQIKCPAAGRIKSVVKIFSVYKTSEPKSYTHGISTGCQRVTPAILTCSM